MRCGRLGSLAEPRQASLLDAAAHFLRGELESLAEVLPEVGQGVEGFALRGPGSGASAWQSECCKQKDSRPSSAAKRASALELLRELRTKTASMQLGISLLG